VILPPLVFPGKIFSHNYKNLKSSVSPRNAGPDGGNSGPDVSVFGSDVDVVVVVVAPHRVGVLLADAGVQELLYVGDQFGRLRIGNPETIATAVA
jgi:hypothetical protein